MEWCCLVCCTERKIVVVNSEGNGVDVCVCEGFVLSLLPINVGRVTHNAEEKEPKIERKSEKTGKRTQVQSFIIIPH